MIHESTNSIRQIRMPESNIEFELPEYLINRVKLQVSQEGKEVDCINNRESTFFVSDLKETVEFYECPFETCKTLGYFCEVCADKCHKHSDKTNMAKKKILKKDIKCMCAKDNHSNLEKDTSKKTVPLIGKEEDPCDTLSKILCKLNIQICAKGKKDDDLVCLYCYDTCVNKEDYTLIEKFSEINGNTFECRCRKKIKDIAEQQNSHKILFMKKKVIKFLLQENYKINSVDKLVLMGKIFTNQDFNQGFLEFNNVINNIFSVEEGNSRELEKIFSMNSFIQIIEFMETFTDLTKKSVYDIASIDNYLLKQLNFQFLQHILKFKKDMPKEISCGVLPKLIYYFRFLQIYPKVKIKNMKLILKHKENISPLHRYFLKDKIDVLFDRINIGQKDMDKFLEDVYEIIRDLLKEGVDTEGLAELIRQYLQFFELFFCFKMNKEFFTKICLKVLGIVKFYKSNPNVFRKTNDETKNLKGKEKSELNTKMKNKRNDKMQHSNEQDEEEKEVEEKVKVKVPQEVEKETHQPTHKKKNKIEKLNQDLKKLMPLLVISFNDIEFQSKIFEKRFDSKHGFIFQIGELQKVILQIFYYGDSQNFSGLYIYHSMLEKNDQYIDNLRYMLNSTENFFQEEFFECYNNKFDKDVLFENNHKTDNSQEFEKRYTDIKINYFMGNEKTLKSLTDLKNFSEEVSKEIKLILSLTSKDVKYVKQLYLMKNTYFELGIDIFKFATYNTYFHNTEFVDLVFKIVEICIEHILTPLTEGNAFLGTVFFTPKIINLFFKVENKKYFWVIQKFYLSMLNSISQSGVKINVKYILDKITKKKEENSFLLNKQAGYGSNFTGFHTVSVEDIQINFKERDLDKCLNDLFQLYYKLLCVSTENTEVYVNDLMINVMKKILNCTKIREKMKVYYNGLISGKVKTDLESLILTIFKILNKISNNYFYLINSFIPTRQIEDYLSLYKNLNPKSRIIIQSLYVRHIFQFPYKVDNNWCQAFKKILTRRPKLEDGIPDEDDNFSKDKDEDNVNSGKPLILVEGKPDDQDSPCTKIKKVDLLISKEFSSECSLLDKEPREQYKDLETMKNILNNFKVMIMRYEKDNFKNNPEFLLSFFEHVVLCSSLHALYKIVYFNYDIMNIDKYYIYAIVYLFLECLRYVLWINLDKSKVELEQFNIIFYRHFIMDDNEKKETTLMFQKLYREVDEDIKDITNSNYNYLNFKEFLSIFHRYAKKFTIYEKQNEQIYVKHKKDYCMFQNRFYSRMSEFYTSYTSEKKNPQNNLMIKIMNRNNEDELFQVLKTKIVVDLVEKLQKYGNRSNEIKDSIEIPIGSGISDIFKVIKKTSNVDPSIYQKHITNKENIIVDNLLLSISNKLPYMMQFVLMEYCNYNIVPEIPFLTIFKDILDFISCLCEKHDKLAILVAKCKINEFNNCRFEDLLMTFVSLILEHLKYFDKKKDILLKLNPLIFSFENKADQKKKNPSQKYNNKFTFFTQFQEKIFHLASELIRGCRLRLYEPKQFGAEFEYGFNFFKKLSLELLKKTEIINTFDGYLYHFILFIDVISFEYKKECDIKIKEVQNVLIYCFKELYKECINDSEEIEKNSHDKLFRKILDNSEILKKDKFLILSKMATFLHNIAALDSPVSQKYRKFVKNMKEYSKKTYVKDRDSDKLKNEDATKTILGELHLLFKKLVRNVEIVISKNVFQAIDIQHESFKNELLLSESEENLLKNAEDISKNSNDSSPTLIYFVLNHEGLILLNDEKLIQDNFFEASKSKEGFNEKMQFLIDYHDYIDTLVEIKKEYRENERKMFVIDMLNRGSISNNIELISSVFTVLTNVSVALSIYYIFPLDQNRTLGNPFFIWTMIITIIHLLFLSLIIGVMLFKEMIIFNSFVKQTEIKKLSREEGEEVEGKTKKQELNYFEHFSNNKIYPLIWNFVFGLIGILNQDLFFLLPLQMFSIIPMFPTMRAAVSSVVTKYKEFLAAGFVILILIIFYSTISVVFFKDNFYNDDMKENICDGIFHCILSLLSNGVKSGAGFGFSMTSPTDPYYWWKFILEWIFYFTIILVMLNIINGIIVDTFQAMRQENEIIEKNRKNLCYICGISRSKFEAHGVAFDTHKKKDHYLFNYMLYFLKVKKSEVSELNSVETMILHKINNSRTDFLPIKKARRLDN